LNANVKRLKRHEAPELDSAQPAAVSRTRPNPKSLNEGGTEEVLPATFQSVKVIFYQGNPS